MSKKKEIRRHTAQRDRERDDEEGDGDGDGGDDDGIGSDGDGDSDDDEYDDILTTSTRGHHESPRGTNNQYKAHSCNPSLGIYPQLQIFV